MRFINRFGRHSAFFPGFYCEGEGGGNKGGDFDLTKVVQALIANKGGGDPSKALAAVVEENYDLRTKNRDLKAKNEEASKGIPEGGRILSKEEVEAYEKYKSFGKPEEIEKTVQESTAAKQQLAEVLEKQTVSSAASMFGYKPTVLSDLIVAKALKLELTEIDVTDEKGAQSKKPSAFIVKQDGTKVRLDEYVKSDLSDYQASLVASEQSTSTGVPWVAQQSSGGKAPANVSPGAAYLAKAYATPDKK